MRTPRRGRSAILALLCAWSAACGPAPVVLPPTPATTAPAVFKDEVPAAQLGPTLAANLEGLGRMERYEYGKAVVSFREVRRLAPGWIPGSINLAIALLNDTGTKAEEAKKKGEAEPESNFDEAVRLLGDVLARDPKNLHARFCRGLIREFQGNIAQAHADYRAVSEGDPTDANAWYKVASTLPDSAEAGTAGVQEKARETIKLLTRALELNPYLVPALYRLQGAYRTAGDRAKQAELLAVWNRLNPKNNAAAPGELVENFYGESGRYARIINPLPAAKRVADVVPPRFAPPTTLVAALAADSRWAREGDFLGPLAVVGRARARLGAAMAAFDADGDGKLDLYVAAAVVGPKGLRDALLLNRGGGRFEDATLSLGLPEDRASLGIAAGDFDADRRIDLYLTGVGDNRLFRNLGRDGFRDITREADAAGPAGLSVAARWVDLDQDGDLDLYVVNYAPADRAAEAFTGAAIPGMVNAAFRNDGTPPPTNLPAAKWMPLANEPPGEKSAGGLSLKLTPWPDAEALLGGVARHTGMVAAYLDDDRDLDLALASDDGPIRIVLNDRLGRFHAADVDLSGVDAAGSGLMAADLDNDGRTDLVATSRSRSRAWRNVSTRGAEAYRLAFEPAEAQFPPFHDATSADLDLDTSPDLVALGRLAASGGDDSASPAWVRFPSPMSPTVQGLAIAPTLESADPLRGVALADVAGSPLPDLILWRDGQGPSVAANLGNGRHWLALDLGGRWKTDFDFMRTNPHAIGTRITVEGQGLLAPVDLIMSESGPAQSVTPVVVGLGDHASADLLRLRWPDGVMQCELNVPADQFLSLAEYNRKTGSCPVLFTWNGARFDCIGDFLGGGGLGYLVAPGVYGQPDRDESVFIAPDQLKPVDGVLRLAVAEPMDEMAYVDRLILDAVDHPPGVSVTLDERFAPEGPRPTGALVAYRAAIEPVHATDLKGVDATATLRAFDRRTVEFPRLAGWIGYAEEHGMVLDFGDRLRAISPETPLVLALAGWVEYPYSQTNYAAATAGVPLMPPVLERLQDDGSWAVLEASPGYPAGLPRMTTLDLTGRLTGPRCVLRLRTNMECYYDRAFLAVREPDAGVRVTTLAISRAELGYRGYLREVSPDGRLPLLYDHDYADPAPLARLDGHLTRYGDVAALLREDDDRQCLIGPGDEAKVEFDARSLPPLPDGWTRSYVLRSVGYCKDADPATAASDTVGPLPWKGMPGYPFGPAGDRPRDASYEAYLREYQSRPTGVR